MPDVRDAKNLVREGYDRCAARYDAARVREREPTLGGLLERLPPNAEVLDVGCGSGAPVTVALARVARVTGVDVSAKQIARARARVPQGRFIVGDVMAQTFAPGCFDAIVSLYAIFHLPREEHRALLERLAHWLRPGGHLLLSVGNTDNPGITEPDFFGVPMYWSHFEPGWYVEALQALGFQVTRGADLGHGYRVGSAEPERHPLLFARAPDG